MSVYPRVVIGNSEVGHQNIGAGRIVNQELLRISTMIRSGEFAQNEVLLERNCPCQKARNTISISWDWQAMLAFTVHLNTYMDFSDSPRANRLKANQVLIHNFSDGRDCQPDLGIQFCEQIEAKLKEIGIGQIASVVGRYYAMDRDDRWERVEVAYRLLTEGMPATASLLLQTPIATITKIPDDTNRKGDEFVRPSVVVGPRR